MQSLLRSNWRTNVTRRFGILFLVGSLGCASAFAHHNGSAHYQMDKMVAVDGVVTEFKLVNPHTLIYFQVKDPGGKPEVWMAEGDAAAVLRRRGWTGHEMKPGDKIKVNGHPSRDGSKMLEWDSIVLANGTVMGGGNGLKEERDKSLEELDKQRRATQPQNPAGAQ